MNRRIRRQIASGKHKIEKRLEAAVRPNYGGPVMSDAINIHYELADKTRAISYGGIGLIARLVRKVGLVEQINSRLHLLKVHHPYHESDHVLNFAYNALCGGRTLEDIELRRNDQVFLDALGAESIPDPTTAGDFCRRFSAADVDILQDAINATRVGVWRRQGKAFTNRTARIDADGSIIETTGECKDGMDISYDGKWGYNTLLVSLANTGEPLFFFNRSGNRPSHEGVIPYFDKAITLMREAGFTDILLRGDTDFSLTKPFDRWTDDSVRFMFGYDARPSVRMWAETAPDEVYEDLVQRAERAIKTKPRAKPEKVKDRIVKERGFTKLTTTSEEVIEFPYKPRSCKRTYRMIAIRKNISVEKGEAVLFPEIRYFFYITNDESLTPHEVVHECRQRCNQENLIEQFKNGVRALHAPVNTLVANWAYMVMAGLAWTLKAWAALMLPIAPRWKERHEAEKSRLLRMDFRTFLSAIINVPAQIVKTGRRIVYRLLAWTRWQHVFFRLVDAL